VRRSPLLSLFGEYASLAEPLSPKPLAVDIYGLTSPSSLLRGVARFSARVHAEAVAASVAGAACMVWRDGRAELRVTFSDLRGATNDIVVRRRCDGAFVRSLTELTGHLLGADGAVFATARLRLNWRMR
jgi:hypothetical protein